MVYATPSAWLPMSVSPLMCSLLVFTKFITVEATAFSTKLIPFSSFFFQYDPFTLPSTDRQFLVQIETEYFCSFVEKKEISSIEKDLIKKTDEQQKLINSLEEKEQQEESKIEKIEKLLSKMMKK